jgi:DNA-binding NtrC family response regulator
MATPVELEDYLQKLLLVDDEESILKMFKSILEMDDFAVETASSAGAGIAALNNDTFDVVVTDLRMETQLAGYDVVRAATNLRPKPVVAIVTAFPVPASEWKKAGADALFVKGNSPFDLSKQLHRLADESSAHSDGDNESRPRTSRHRIQ